MTLLKVDTGGRDWNFNLPNLGLQMGEHLK